MKIRDTDMGERFSAMKREDAIELIAGCIFQGLPNVFDSIRRLRDFRAPTVQGVAEKVYDNMMDFDLDELKDPSRESRETK
jgi:hypothetical protein